MDRPGRRTLQTSYKEFLFSPIAPVGFDLIRSLRGGTHASDRSVDNHSVRRLCVRQAAATVRRRKGPSCANGRQGGLGRQSGAIQNVPRHGSCGRGVSEGAEGARKGSSSSACNRALRGSGSLRRSRYTGRVQAPRSVRGAFAAWNGDFTAEHERSGSRGEQSEVVGSSATYRPPSAHGDIAGPLTRSSPAGSDQKRRAAKMPFAAQNLNCRDSWTYIPRQSTTVALALRSVTSLP